MRPAAAAPGGERDRPAIETLTKTRGQTRRLFVFEPGSESNSRVARPTPGWRDAAAP